TAEGLEGPACWLPDWHPGTSFNWHHRCGRPRSHEFYPGHTPTAPGRTAALSSGHGNHDLTASLCEFRVEAFFKGMGFDIVRWLAPPKLILSLPPGRLPVLGFLACFFRPNGAGRLHRADPLARNGAHLFLL